MKLNNPLPQPLPKECQKAVNTFLSFVDKGNNGLDGVIPRTVLEHAKGFAIFTVFKAGFLLSARAGSGIVIAKLDDGSWSSPSAIGLAGVGLGGQAGAEMTDFLVVLNSSSAVNSFMAAGSLTLGGNLSVAVGPLGRTGEASGSVNSSGKLAATYSYSKTRGLFGGISIEGTVIMAREDANVQAYQAKVTAKSLLSGQVTPPPWAAALIKAIETCTGMPGNRQWVNDATTQSPYLFDGVGSSNSKTNTQSPITKLKAGRRPSFPPSSWGKRMSIGSYFDSSNREMGAASASSNNQSNTDGFETHFESDFAPTSPSLEPFHPPRLPLLPASLSAAKSSALLPVARSSSLPHSKSSSISTQLVPSPKARDDSSADVFHWPPTLSSLADQAMPPPYINPKPELTRPLLPHEGVARAIALYDFRAVEPGDLSFSKGDVIIITKKSDWVQDWWTGKLNGKEGIFPANFVEVV